MGPTRRSHRKDIHVFSTLYCHYFPTVNFYITSTLHSNKYSALDSIDDSLKKLLLHYQLTRCAYLVYNIIMYYADIVLFTVTCQAYKWRMYTVCVHGVCTHQAYRSPVFVSAKLHCNPQKTRTTSRPSRASMTLGTGQPSLFPWPSLPKSPSPQDRTLPEA